MFTLSHGDKRFGVESRIFELRAFGFEVTDGIGREEVYVMGWRAMSKYEGGRSVKWREEKAERKRKREREVCVQSLREINTFGMETIGRYL